MLNERKKSLQAEIKSKQKELEELDIRELQEFKDKTNHERKNLLKQLKEITEQLEACEREEHKKRKELCKKYGHYLVTSCKHLHIIDRNSFEHGTIGTYSEKCICCGYSRSYTAEMSAYHSGNQVFSKQKKSALKQLESEFSQKKEPLLENIKIVQQKLQKLYKEYIARVLGPEQLHFTSYSIYSSYENGTEEDAEKIKSEWFTM